MARKCERGTLLESSREDRKERHLARDDLGRCSWRWVIRKNPGHASIADRLVFCRAGLEDQLALGAGQLLC